MRRGCLHGWCRGWCFPRGFKVRIYQSPLLEVFASFPWLEGSMQKPHSWCFWRCVLVVQVFHMGIECGDCHGLPQISWPAWVLYHPWHHAPNTSFFSTTRGQLRRLLCNLSMWHIYVHTTHIPNRIAARDRSREALHNVCRKVLLQLQILQLETYNVMKKS